MELNRQLRRRVTGLCGEFLMALAMAGIGSPLQAAPLALYPGMGGVPDMGAIHCRTFNEMYPAGPNGLRQAILYWTGGYVYAQTGKTLDEVLAAPGMGTWNFETLTDHIVEFCKAQPDAPVPFAVIDLWNRNSSGSSGM